jgi:dihydroxyacetone kinase-like protein
LLHYILEDMKATEGDEIQVLVNGLGALPLMDLYVCFRRLHQILVTKGIIIRNSWVGNYATSMDMAGMSITLMRLDEELKELMDKPCDTPWFKII